MPPAEPEKKGERRMNPPDRTSDEPASTSDAEEPEPVFTGTLFLMVILLMLIFGFWVMMYLTMLER
jgi:hypothetical protein